MVIFGRKPNVVERNKLKRIEDRLPMEIASQIGLYYKLTSCIFLEILILLMTKIL